MVATNATGSKNGDNKVELKEAGAPQLAAGGWDVLEQQHAAPQPYGCSAAACQQLSHCNQGSAQCRAS
jgi:hypothetical protein